MPRVRIAETARKKGLDFEVRTSSTLRLVDFREGAPMAMTEIRQVPVQHVARRRLDRR